MPKLRVNLALVTAISFLMDGSATHASSSSVKVLRSNFDAEMICLLSTTLSFITFSTTEMLRSLGLSFN